jgi:glycosyltransferase involved in cell wall biosynthesis
MKSTHLLVAVHDGILTHYTGVGTIAANTVHILLKHLEDFPTLRVSLATIAIDPAAEIFNRDNAERAADLVNRTDGILARLCNDTFGADSNDAWGGTPGQWIPASCSLASVADTICRPNERLFVMCHDTVFLYFQIAKRQLRHRARTYLLPHSTGKNHAFLDAAVANVRIEYEKRCFSSAIDDRATAVVATGYTFGQHLTSAYGVPVERQLRLLNGLAADLYPETSEKVSPSVIEALASITPGRRVLFTWGRCSGAKGLVPLAAAWSSIAYDYPEHVLVIQAPNQSGEDDYFAQLVEIAERHADNIRLLTAFSPKVWRAFLRSELTEVVCLLSTADPNPHTPMEAKLFAANMRYAVLASRVDGLRDTFAEGECIFVEAPITADRIVPGLRAALSLSETERRSMCQRNFASTTQYDYERNLLSFLRAEGITAST